MKNRRLRKCCSALEAASGHYFESFWIQVFVVIITILSCLWYIVEAYTTTPEAPLTDVSICLELIFFFVFLVDYIFCIIIADQKLEYLTGFSGFVDLASLIPVLSVIPESTTALRYSFGFLGFLRFFRLVKVYQLISLRHALKPGNSPHDTTVAIETTEAIFLISRLAINIAVFLLVSTGLVYTFVLFDPLSFEDNTKSKLIDGEPINWLDCLYFVIISVATVGYGDIVPVSNLARVLVILIVLVGFSIIPVQVAAVAQALLFAPQFLGQYKVTSGKVHVCICGIVDYELLDRFLNELFHPTHRRKMQKSIIAVVLSPTPPSDQVSFLFYSFILNTQ